MFEPLNEHLITEFETCLAEPAPAGRKKEQVVQEFLEANTVLIPTPHRLNHGLHFKSIISKFPITSGLETDYVYLSKSSGSWQITFVELESPDKSIFTGATKTVQPSAEFQQAVSQIEDWRTYLSENKQEILNRLSPLIQPMSRNPINFKYQLIIGRSQNKNLTPQRQNRFERMKEQLDIEIMTYDALISWYRSDYRYLKNVLAYTKGQFRFKKPVSDGSSLFAYLTPSVLLLSEEDEQILRSQGYQIDAWKAGEPLSFNDRFPLRKDADGKWSLRPY